MFELPPLLLALAFVLIGVAAWFLGRRMGAARTVRLPRDYYIGLDHLINDRFDHAAEIFARMAEADGDAAEIQFALGTGTRALVRPWSLYLLPAGRPLILRRFCCLLLHQ